MRRLAPAPAVALAIALVAMTGFGAVGVSAQEPPDGGSPEGGNGEQGEPENGNNTGSGGNQTGPGNGNVTTADEGNETGSQQPGTGPGRGPPGHARAHEVAQSKQQQQRATIVDPRPAWAAAVGRAGADPGFTERAAEMRTLPPQAQQKLGLFTATDDGFEGRYVSFLVDPGMAALYDVRIAGTPVFGAVYFPIEGSLTVYHHGNYLEFAGDQWRFHIVDTPAGNIHMRATGAPIQLVLANATPTQGPGNTLHLSFPAAEGPVRDARIVGAASLDPTTPGLVSVSDAAFHVAAQQAALTNVASHARPQLQAALERRDLGGEITLLAPSAMHPGAGVLSEVVPFEAVEIVVRPGEGLGDVPENSTVQTILVSAEGLGAKSFVVNIEAGILDAQTLVVRYYDLVGGAVTEVPIHAAASLEEALDPSGSEEPRYWLFSSADGLQIVFTVPFFSVHALELLGFPAEIVVKVVITLGILGAVALVAIAVVGLFRRPEDTL